MRRESLRAGIRAGIPFAIAAGLLAVSFGILAEPVFGSTATLVMSAFVFAGSAQFGALAVLGPQHHGGCSGVHEHRERDPVHLRSHHEVAIGPLPDLHGALSLDLRVDAERAPGRQQLAQAPVDVALDLGVLGDRLDDDLTLLQMVEIEDHAGPSDLLCGLLGGLLAARPEDHFVVFRGGAREAARNRSAADYSQ